MSDAMVNADKDNTTHEEWCEVSKISPCDEWNLEDIEIPLACMSSTKKRKESMEIVCRVRTHGITIINRTVEYTHLVLIYKRKHPRISC